MAPCVVVSKLRHVKRRRSDKIRGLPTTDNTRQGVGEIISKYFQFSIDHLTE